MFNNGASQTTLYDAANLATFFSTNPTAECDIHHISEGAGSAHHATVFPTVILANYLVLQHEFTLGGGQARDVTRHESQTTVYDSLGDLGR